MSAIERAIDSVGTLTEFAKKLEVDPQVVVNWKKRRVPAERVLDVEKATVDPETGHPRVTRHDLRPDLYPPEERVAA